MAGFTSKEVRDLREAYQQVYAPQEITEEQVWEQVEEWVNGLLDEGYDLSDYTWEEMYEAYIEEAVGLVGVPKRSWDPLNIRQKILDASRRSDYPASYSEKDIPTTKSGKVVPRSMAEKGKTVVDAGTQTAKPTPKKDPRDLGGFVPGDDRMPGQKAKPTLLNKPASTSSSSSKPSAPEPRIGSRNKEGKVYAGKDYGYQSWDTAKGKLKLGSEVIGSQRPAAAAPAKPAPAASRPAAAAPAKPAPAASRPAAAAPAKPAPAAAPSAPPAPAAAPSAPPAPRTDAPPAPKSTISSTLDDLRRMKERSQARQGIAAHTDLFDLVKGYLLDEGYADTEEAALAIMSSMSEEWRDSIVEQSAISARAAKVVDDQRQGYHGNLDAINKLQDAASRSMGRLKKGQGPVVTPGFPGV